VDDLYSLGNEDDDAEAELITVILEDLKGQPTDVIAQRITKELARYKAENSISSIVRPRDDPGST
jgi:hypothetical protein